jgi:hypothetical protein
LLRCARSSCPVGFGRAQGDLDVDLHVGGIDPGRVVDGVGIDAPALERELDPPPLGDGEVGAFADHLGLELGRGDADRIVGRSPTSALVSLEART